MFYKPSRRLYKLGPLLWNENMKKIIFLSIFFLLAACGPTSINPLSLISEKGVEVNRPDTQPNGQEKENPANFGVEDEMMQSMGRGGGRTAKEMLENPRLVVELDE